MATIANLIVNIKAEASQLNKGLSSAQSKINKFSSNAVKSIFAVSKAFAALAASGAAALAASLNSAANSLDDLGDQAGKLGVTAQALQLLRYQAELSDSSIESVGTSLKFLTKNIGLAGQGSKPLLETFSKLGLDVEKLKQLAPEKQFYVVAEALKKIKTQSDLSAIASQIFGKSFIDILPLIKSNLKETEEQFKSFNIGVTEAEVNAADKFDKMKKSWTNAFEGFKQKVAGQVLISMFNIQDGLDDAGTSFKVLGLTSADVSKYIILGMQYAAEAISLTSKEVYKLTAALDVAKNLFEVSGVKIGESIAKQVRLSEISGDVKSGARALPLPGQVEQELTSAEADLTPKFQRIDFALEQFANPVTRASSVMERFVSAASKEVSRLDELGNQQAAANSVTQTKTAPIIQQQTINGVRSFSDGSNNPTNINFTVKGTDGLIEVIDQRIDRKTTNSATGVR